MFRIQEKLHTLFRQETKRHSLVRFLLVVIVLVVYFVFISIRYGAGHGAIITLLTWSFFVLSTPIADAGALIDLPVRLLAGIRMIYSEISVWIIAIGVNIYFIFSHPQVYDTTFILSLFRHILINPFPYWVIILLSAIGTFLSVYFGDELLDVVRHSERNKFHKHGSKFEFIVFIFIILLTIILYHFLLDRLGITLPLHI